MQGHYIEISVLESIGLLIAEHGVGFAGAGGPVGKNSGVEAIEDSFDEGLDSFDINLRMRGKVLFRRGGCGKFCRRRISAPWSDAGHR